MPSCTTCGHDHDNVRGEICGVCGHRSIPFVVVGIFSQMQQIISPYLFMGSYDHAYRLLNTKTVNPFTHFLSAVPGFLVPGGRYDPDLRFHVLTNDINTQFDETFEFIRECEEVGRMVLVYCMTGIGRSAAVVIAYLMRLRSWSLKETLGWLRHRWREINLTSVLVQQLEYYEQKIFPNRITNANVKHD